MDKAKTDCPDIQTKKVSCGTGAESQGSHKITRVAFCGRIQSHHKQINRELRQSLLRVVTSNIAYFFNFLNHCILMINAWLFNIVALCWR